MPPLLHALAAQDEACTWLYSMRSDRQATQTTTATMVPAVHGPPPCAAAVLLTASLATVFFTLLALAGQLLMQHLHQRWPRLGVWSASLARLGVAAAFATLAPACALGELVPVQRVLPSCMASFLDNLMNVEVGGVGRERVGTRGPCIIACNDQQALWYRTG